MNTRHFTVKGTIDCFFSPPSGAVFENIAGIEVQLWHKGPMEDLLIGKAITDSNGEFIFEADFESPATFIDDGKIKDTFLKAYYKGTPLTPMTYDADAIAYFNKLSPQPSSEFKSAINDLVLRLKADNNWSKLDRLWIHATENQQHATISLVNPSTTAISEVSGPTWAANQGYTGNGTSSYLNSNYTPSTDAIQYVLNSAAFGFYSRTNSVVGSVDMGNYVPTTPTRFSEIWTRYGSNAFLAAINEGSSDITGTSLDSRGLFCHVRTSSSNVELFRNAASLGSSGAHTSTGLVTKPFFMLARNNDGTADSYSTRQLAISFVGSGSLDMTSFYNSIQTFATSRGFNV